MKKKKCPICNKNLADKIYKDVVKKRLKNKTGKLSLKYLFEGICPICGLSVKKSLKRTTKKKR